MTAEREWLRPGYRLDRYELLCPVAQGGMGTVWLARFVGSLGFQRLVVVKMVLSEHSDDGTFQRMFFDEARIISRIEHPNVARVLDVGDHKGTFYIVMEWVDGDTVSAMLRTARARARRIPVGVALRICADAAAGLHAAHRLEDGGLLRVVHRDVSPQNLLVSSTGTTVVIDFGIATVRDRFSPDTQAGRAKGKVRYMAPEQALGQPVDHRADIWALGVVLHEMVSGGPFLEGSDEAVLRQLKDPRRSIKLALSLPLHVRGIVETACAAAPHDRFASAEDFRLTLEETMSVSGDSATASGVSLFVGHLLSEQSLARKKQIDETLEAARAREASSEASELSPEARDLDAPAVPPVPPTALTSPSSPIGHGTSIPVVAPAETDPNPGAFGFPVNSAPPPETGNEGAGASVGPSPLRWSRPLTVAALASAGLGIFALAVWLTFGRIDRRGPGPSPVQGKDLPAPTTEVMPEGGASSADAGGGSPRPKVRAPVQRRPHN